MMVPEHKSKTTASEGEVGKVPFSLCDFCRVPHFVV